MMKIGVLALYALMMVAVIVLTARKKLSLNEFLLGGRNVGPWLSALSYGASYFSAVIIGGKPAGLEAAGPPHPPHGRKAGHGHDSRLL